MTRMVLCGCLLLIVVCNAGFDVIAGPSGLRFAARYERERMLGNPTFAPSIDPKHHWYRRWEARVRLAVRGWNAHLPLWKIARWVLALRYGLTIVPLLVLVVPAVRRRLRDSRLGLAIALGALILAAKAAMWEALWLMIDVCAGY